MLRGVEVDRDEHAELSGLLNEEQPAGESSRLVQRTAQPARVTATHYLRDPICPVGMGSTYWGW